MKTLLELQKEVKQLESNLQAVSIQLQTINRYLSTLQKAEAMPGDTMDFKLIKKYAKQMPFTFHPLQEIEDEETKKLYLMIILSVVVVDEHTMDRCVFIQWIICQSRIKLGFLDLLRASYKYSREHLVLLTEKVTKDMITYLLIDLLIVLNLSDSATDGELSYIAELASLFGTTAKELKVYSTVARCVLEQSMGQLSRKEKLDTDSILKKCAYYFSCEVMTKMRYIAVSQVDKDDITFKWKVEQMSQVTKGTLIAEVITCSKSGVKRTEKVIATVSGILYEFRYNCTNYGVISSGDDNKDSIKAWIKQREGK